MGRHRYYLNQEQISNAVRLDIIGQPFGIMAFCVPKLAVALLIIKLMPPKKYEKWFLYFITISLIIFSILAAIFLFVQCSPPQALWNHKIPFHCWPPSILSNYTIFVGGMIVPDCYILWKTAECHKLTRRSAISAWLYSQLQSFGIYKWIWERKLDSAWWWVWECCEWFARTFRLTFHITNCTIGSAFLCAIIKTTKLNEMQDHADFTCA